jgi:glycosyltransferase involved in cell wall biosynthesis
MRVLVWQWGRRGAGPRFAAQLADACNALPGVQAGLSLSSEAEILRERDAPHCDIVVPTYRNLAGLVRRAAGGRNLVAQLTSSLRVLTPDLAICAMPGPLDLFCQTALRRAGVPVAVVAHDATTHPGDGFPLLMTLQTQLLRRADAVVVLSSHVAEQLRARRMIGPREPLIVARLPPLFDFGTIPPPRTHHGPLRLLMFGRLLPYKGLDLLEAALRRLGDNPGVEVRIVGSGPESAALAALRRNGAVAVDNRWVAESEIGPLLAWSDVLVLPYREASQSGVAASALAAGRVVVSTRVGGLAEQLTDEPLAMLCEPDADSLATALRQVRDALVAAAPRAAPPSPATAWRAMACELLRELATALRLCVDIPPSVS